MMGRCRKRDLMDERRVVLVGRCRSEDVAGRRETPGPAATATFPETARLNSLGRQAAFGPID
jgi:hypothetical protein